MEDILDDSEILSALREKAGEYTSIRIADEGYTLTREDYDKFISWKFNWCSYRGNTLGCGYTLASPTGYKPASNLIKQIAKYHNDNETVSNKTSNRLNWYYTTYTKSGINCYQYATEKDGKIYLLTFEHDIYSNSNCPTYKDQVLNNIK